MSTTGPNNIVGGDIQDVGAAAQPLASVPTIASVEITVASGNSADVTIEAPGLQAGGVALPAGISFGLLKVDLSQVLVSSASEGQRITYMGDTYP